MPISVECPACEHEFHIPNSYGGKKGKCPECGKVFVAPKIDSAKPPPRSSVQPPAPQLSGSSRTAPVPPPPQLVGHAGDARASAAPAMNDRITANDAAPPISNGAPPVDKSAVAASPPVQPLRSERDGRQVGASPRRSKNKPLWIAVGVLSAMLVVSAVLLVQHMRLDGKELVKDNNKNTKTPPKRIEKGTDKLTATPAAETILSQEDLKDVPVDRLWDEFRPAVFRLVAKRGEDQVTGLAFAIDQRGWLATSYQLVKDAETVNVAAIRDPSAESIAAAGIVASSAERNIAIIAIEQKPAAILGIKPATPKGDEQLAVCRSESGKVKLAPGYFLGLVSFDDLPANSRAVARLHGLDRESNPVWLEHNQHLAASDDGGPLLNLDGKVIGMNASLSPESKVGYALPSAYLLELFESAGDKVRPFSPSANSVASSDTAAVTKDGEEPPDTPKPLPPSRPKPGTLESIDVIRELHKTCKELNWQPATPSEYGLFQDLAEYVYVAKANESDEGIEEGLRILIASPAQEVLVELSKTKWPEEAEINELNALAAEGLKRDGKGVFCYVEIANPNPDPMSVDGVPVILCELIGTDQSVVVPVRKNSSKLRRKTRWLLIGKHDTTQTLNVRTTDGSEKPSPLIRAKHLLGEPKVLPEKTPPRRRGRR